MSYKTKKLIKGILPVLIALILLYAMSSKENGIHILPVEETYESLNVDYATLNFRSEERLEEHYQEHVVENGEFGDISMEDYLQGARMLFSETPAEVQIKQEEDGDWLYYDVVTNEFGVLSADGYIRTFFKPSDGQAYFERQ